MLSANSFFAFSKPALSQGKKDYNFKKVFPVHHEISPNNI